MFQRLRTRETGHEWRNGRHRIPKFAKTPAETMYLRRSLIRLKQICQWIYFERTMTKVTLLEHLPVHLFCVYLFNASIN